MKLSVLFVLIFCFPLLVRAADPVPAPTAGVVKEAPADSGEFQDPFAEPETAGARGASQRGVRDPLEPMNRAFFKFNDKLYLWVLRPTARGYNKVAPEPFRASVRRFFVNLRYPVRFANNVLQGKFKGAGIETARFLANSTLGIGGLFDPAREEWRLEPRPEDLDQTLGVYRIPPGIYLHWPIFGPSSVRGTVGTVGDGYLSPLGFLDLHLWERLGARAYDTVNATSLQLGEYEDFKKATFDPYVALRTGYFERREAQIKE
jgi:phospholipid-binding lipoprotein MlaA